FLANNDALYRTERSIDMENFLRRLSIVSKKVLILVVAVVVVGALAVYFTKTSAPEATTDATTFKIGLVTGTVSQNEDEYRGAEAAIAKYPGLIKHVTYPDNFMQEQETFIAQV